ncbi:hypothetical protein BST96_00085 [Oceanicoccus sagamiensis]|uniref:Uncharacterized protein n=1 Tax=Oceanicoccus sagamiensis TaxID=716816 RepID=A0A1X9N361_9GAMM|nr:hypothetical protein BST96_00085 [Oceanicoccus sagamiensis]
MNRINNLACILIITMLQACGGSGGGSSSKPPVPEEPVVSTGVFLDSPVAGLYFETETQAGTTNDAGEFTYIEGETVAFSLGVLNLVVPLAEKKLLL